MRVSLGNQMLGPEWKLSFFIMKVKLKVISDILSALVSFYIDKNLGLFRDLVEINDDKGVDQFNYI